MRCFVGTGLALIACLLSAGGPTAKPPPRPATHQIHPAFAERAGDRAEMVRRQLVGRDITSLPVLKAMLRVPRHTLVPDRWRHQAYADHPLAIGHGQTISQPYIVAFMTQAVRPGPRDRVLEIGTGSGYQAAVLAELVREVYTIEIVGPLGERAKRDLTALGYDNIRFRVGDGYRGWPEAAPFDAILVTAAPDHVPPRLVEQLAVGGRMVIPVGKGVQKLLLIERTRTEIRRKMLFSVLFVPMTGEAQEHQKGSGR